ncbi:MAG: hypothetical protein AB7F98_17385 [Novosphingobium sp.]
MTPRNLLCLAIAPLALAACTQERPDDRPAVSPAARVTGPAVNCVPITRLGESRIRDDWTIDFMRDSKRGWRNVLPNRCSGLKSADAFTHKTSLSQLCSTDIIHVLDRIGNDLRKGAGCGLGQFIPIELEK